MATIDIYAGGFVGNDFVTQQLPKKKPISRAKIRYSEPQAAPIQYMAEASFVQAVEPISLAPVTESAAIVNDYVTAIPDSNRRLLPSFTFLANYKKQIITYGMLFIVVSAVLVVSVIAKSTIMHTVRSSVAFTEKTVSSLHTNSPAAFSLPAHSILIRSNDLANDLDDIEAQPINITLGAITISPSPTTISQWVKVTSGPQASAKVLTVNTTSITNYLRNTIESDPQLSGEQARDSALSSVPQMSRQIAQILFSCKGTNITVPTTTSS